MHSTALRGVFVLASLVNLSCAVAAEDWPGWRGPRGDGTSLETSIPTTWSDADNVAWKVPLPGKGHSSPIIIGDRIFLVTCLEDKEERVLMCLDRLSGKTLWQETVVKTPLEGIHRLNSHASGTPATDGVRVYVSFLDVDNIVVAAFDFAGKPLWSTKPGVFSSKHGFCSSPVLFEDKVIVNGDHDGDAYIVALDRATGRQLWKTNRENKTRSYCTPIIRNLDGRTQLILSGSKSVTSFDPRDGSRIWLIDGPTEQFVASMVDNGKLLFMTAGFPDKHILAIRPDGAGNVTDTHIVWRTKQNCSYVPSPIVVGDYFLVVSDEGVASCFLAMTGELQWRERIGRRYSASLVTAGGLAYFTSDDGVTTVVRPGATFDVVAKNELGEACYASAAISRGQLFQRGEKHLFCIGK